MRGLLLVLGVWGVWGAWGAQGAACPASCECLDTAVECRGAEALPLGPALPPWTRRLLVEGASPPPDPRPLLARGLVELELKNCSYSALPALGRAPKLRSLSLAYNRIAALRPDALADAKALETLSLEHNRIEEVRDGAFPPLAKLRCLKLTANSIVSLQENAFAPLAGLEDLRLNRNLIERLPKALLWLLARLRSLDLSRNNISEIEGLSFKACNRLVALDLRHNKIVAFKDGAFFGLNATEELKLDRNRLCVVSKSWTYGLDSLLALSMSRNRVRALERDCWEWTRRLTSLDLSDNRLEALSARALEHLAELRTLRLDGNDIEYVDADAFSHTKALESLDLSRNRISWTVEDMHAPFSGLRRLRELFLAHNHVKSVGDKAFVGLDDLTALDLSGNNITSLRERAFAPLRNVRVFQLNTSSLLCDCDLKWLPSWLSRLSHGSRVEAVCGYPSRFLGRSLSEAEAESFTCGDSPKPRIYEHPKTQMAIKGNDARLSCKAASSSSTRMEFVWRRNNVNVSNPTVVESVIESDNRTVKVASELLLNNVSDSDAGKYQCIVSNSFGITYSNRSSVTIVIFPKFVKIPSNVTVKAGDTAKLVCAATGDPAPEIAWQKDGGNDFFAARERRLLVMSSTDDEFFILNSKVTDTGVYSCTAQNIAGSVMSNATLTVLEAPQLVNVMERKEVTAGESAVIECMVSGSPKPSLRWLKDGEPIKLTERHFFTAEDQLLIIVGAVQSDEGLYECEIANSQGKVNGSAHLRVLPPIITPLNSEEDMMGIIIITVVCCAVGTSIVWVFIIYHTKKRMNSALPQFSPDSMQMAPLSTQVELTNTQLFNSDNISERSSCKDSGTGDSAKRSSLEIIPSDDIQLIVSNTVMPMYLNSSHMVDENHRLLKKDDNIKAFYSDDCEHSVTVQMHVSDDMLSENNLNRTYPYS